MHMVDSVAMSFLNWGFKIIFSLPVQRKSLEYSQFSLSLPQTAASKWVQTERGRGREKGGGNLLCKSSIHPLMQRLGRRNNLPSSQSRISLLWLLALGSPHNKSLGIFQFVHEFVCHKSVE